MYSFTNHFSSPTLRQRIGMMNRRDSGRLIWLRYGLWAIMVVIMALACRHPATPENAFIQHSKPLLPLTNATHVAAIELDKAGVPWFRQAALTDSEENVIATNEQTHFYPKPSYPKILCLRNNHLTFKLPAGEQAKLFINGQEAKPQALFTLSFEEINELLVYEKWPNGIEADLCPESYRVFVSTTHKTPSASPNRTKWKQFLQAAAVSDYPLGQSSSFSMNDLLEATFFSNKLAFVKRTNDNYLNLYDEYTQDIDLLINGLPAKPSDITGIHIREVANVYALERPFDEWIESSGRKSRFALYIQTAPKRAKRDSSHYVFSPFYSGDF